MNAAKKEKTNHDLSSKEVLTYDEYIQIYPAWSQKTIERRMEDDGFPGKKINGVLYINRKAADLWWKRRIG